ncbi:DegT/DnrJ/EryC1/StrS family aminotransferase [Nocardia sp. NPDC003482]
MIEPFTAAVPEDEIATVLAASEQILRSGQLVLGPHTRALEAAVAAMAGTGYAVAVNSGASALEIIFRAVDARRGTVLIPTNTNFATAAAAVNAGARIRFYDSGLYPDVAGIECALDEQVVAVVVVHIGGYLSPDLPRLTRLCHQAGVRLIEDAAHAHGSALDQQPAGGFGYAGAWSLFATKVVSTGEGGVITTNDPDLDRLARQYRDQGKDDRGRHVVWGGSWRMTELGAALGATQLDHLTRDRDQRRAVIDRYSSALADTGLHFPTPHGPVSGHKCIALLADGSAPERFRAALAARGVRLARGVYERPLHRQPIFDTVSVAERFPAADEFAARHVCLPLWRGMPDETVTQVIAAARTVLEE